MYDMIEKDLGFISKRINFRETSLIATVLTEHFGKMQGILKGFYTQKKEFSSSLDLFSLNEFIFYPRRSEIWLVSYVDLVDDYSFLRGDIDKNTTASIFFRIINKCLELHHRNPAVFFLLKDCLGSLRGVVSSRVLYIFLIKFLTLSGFKPEFNLCIKCHNSYEGNVFFSVSSGGLICSKCRSAVPQAHSISLETTSAITYIQNNDFPQVLRLALSRSCEEEIMFILRKFLEYHLHLDLHPQTSYLGTPY